MEGLRGLRCRKGLKGRKQWFPNFFCARPKILNYNRLTLQGHRVRKGRHSLGVLNGLKGISVLKGLHCLSILKGLKGIRVLKGLWGLKDLRGFKC